MKKLAFTLAEVLIVIGIIGIIADMTIPTLKRDIDKIIYVTQLQKFVSTFTQGMKMIMADEGVNAFDHTSIFVADSSMDEDERIDGTIKKAFKTMKTCKYTDTSCKITGYKTLDKAPETDHFEVGYRFYTADGAIVNFILLNDKCDLQNNISSCGLVFVDVNGKKKPNTWGRDLFSFVSEQDGSIHPLGGQRYARYASGDGWASSSDYWKNDATGCGTAGSSVIAPETFGSICAARIIENGWKMDY